MEYTRKNKGVCSRSTTVVLEDNIIKNIEVSGGCDGNLKGVCSLLKGMTATEAITRLRGLTCGDRTSSCPDQIALCIQEAIEQQ